jgi:hypothetical protein
MRHSGRPVARAIVLVIAASGLLAMGGFGGDDAGQPARDYAATFTDADGLAMPATRVTAGGGVTLDGELGRGRLRIPFDNISRITFEPSGTSRDRVDARVQLRDGEPLTLSVRSATTFYGQTPGGAYQIRARDLKAVEFRP